VIRGRRPAITQVGLIVETPLTITITGWQLGLCVSQCSCHRHPRTDRLALAEDTGYGYLGLAQYRTCACCRPWSPAELAAIVRDLGDIEALQHTS
jgi:hypothetical protein